MKLIYNYIISKIKKVCDYSIKCLNSGICSDLNGTCLCLNGYYGNTCELYNHCWINNVITRLLRHVGNIRTPSLPTCRSITNTKKKIVYRHVGINEKRYFT